MTIRTETLAPALAIVESRPTVAPVLRTLARGVALPYRGTDAPTYALSVLASVGAVDLDRDDAGRLVACRINRFGICLALALPLV
jgi:hypothetical protein